MTGRPTKEQLAAEAWEIAKAYCEAIDRSREARRALHPQDRPTKEDINKIRDMVATVRTVPAIAYSIEPVRMADALVMLLAEVDALTAERDALARRVESTPPWKFSARPTSEEMVALRTRWSAGPERYQADFDMVMGALANAITRTEAAEHERDEAQAALVRLREAAVSFEAPLSERYDGPLRDALWKALASTPADLADAQRREWMAQGADDARAQLQARAEEVGQHFSEMRGDPDEIARVGGMADGLEEAAEALRGIVGDLRGGTPLPVGGVERIRRTPRLPKDADGARDEPCSPACSDEPKPRDAGDDQG